MSSYHARNVVSALQEFIEGAVSIEVSEIEDRISDLEGLEIEDLKGTVENLEGGDSQETSRRLISLEDSVQGIGVRLQDLEVSCEMRFASFPMFHDLEVSMGKIEHFLKFLNRMTASWDTQEEDVDPNGASVFGEIKS